MQPQQTRAEEITLADIMMKIRTNIRQGPDRESCNTEDPSVSSDHETAETQNNGIRRDFSHIHANWDIRNPGYCITSHRPYLGKFLVRGRQIIHGEVCRYIDPVIANQTEFNACMVRILTSVSNGQGDLDRRMTHQVDSFSRILDQIEQDKQVQQRAWEQERETIEGRMSSSLARIEQDLASNLKEIKKVQDDEIGLAIANFDHHFAEKTNEINDLIRTAVRIRRQQIPCPPGEFNYLQFEEKFRGTRELIKSRQETFLPFFRNRSRVLDIGCGRGEFLEILRENGIPGSGIDIDPDMIACCRDHQLEAVEADAVEYLESQEDGSYDGIFMDQVIEHLEPEYLLHLLSLCHRKLKDGSFLVAETINPQSFTSLVNFFIDLTHRKPVHPETLLYLFSAAGFSDPEIRYLSPVPDDYRLKTIVEQPGLGDHERKNLEIYNNNINILNAVLFGAQDYAVIGKK